MSDLAAMRSRSILWRSAVALLGLLLFASPAASGVAPRLCLPPLFEGGQRLHQLPAPRVFWLELMLRQHELCWRRPQTREERRVALFGNSAIFGYPLPVEQTFGGVLNQHFAERGIAAHLYNLGWVATYQVRDAMIIHASLAYEPDVLIYPLTPAEFIHFAPAVFPPQLIRFFESNVEPLSAMVDEPPAGLEEPFEEYRAVRDEQSRRSPFYRLRELGSFTRVGSNLYAKGLARRLHPGVFRPPPKTRGRQTSYDCEATKQDNEFRYTSWQEWNVLAYLEELERTRGLEVVVVNWPNAHEPVGDCYNVRYTRALVAEYNDWLAAQARRRGLDYLDLHDLLPPQEFFDSLHVKPEGHRRIAERVAEVIDPLLLERSRGATAEARDAR